MFWFVLMERSYADFYEPSRWRKAKARLGRFGKWIWAALGLGVFAAGYVAAVIGQLLPAPGDVACLVREQFHDPGPGTHFTILISNLAGDADGRQTNLVRDVFLGQRGIDARQTCRVVTLNRAGGSIADAEAKAVAHGRGLLSEWNADLLIWGEVKKADKELNLWFLGREGSGTLGGPSYSVTEKLTLPEGFQLKLGAQLEAVALAQIAPATEQAGTYLVGLLTPLRVKLEQLIASPPPGLDPDQMANVRFSLALAAETIGAQSGDKEPLQPAVEEYRELLDVWTRERMPLDWATVQNNLGATLWTLGEREDNTERLKQAVEAFSAALEVRTRERVPLAWAQTQNNLGNTLRALGEREADTEKLKQAVEAFRAALEVRTRERVPLAWAQSQNNLGTALGALGEHEDDTEKLKQAVEAFSAALEVRTRERVPLMWATTQHNLGLALVVLGAHEDDTQRLEEAVEALRAAVEVRTRERHPFSWALTQENLGLALGPLGTRRHDIALLEQAVTAIQDALAVFEASGASFNISKARANLARTEALLAERQAASATK